MSRIGKQPIPVPSGVEVKIDGSTVVVTGPKGTLTQTFNDEMILQLEDGVLSVSRQSDQRHHRSRIVAMSFCEPRSWTRVLSS